MSKREQVKKLREKRHELENRINKIDAQIERIEPKKVKTYGDPVVEFN